MDGPRSPILFPVLTIAQVTGYDPEHNSVYIRLYSGQSPVLPARMLYRGTTDQYRIEQEPLPLVGTWGVVAFPMNDDRFPIWLGSYYSIPQDAITSSSLIQDSQIKYFSHQSGYYNLLDGFGQQYIRFPDGTQILANQTNTQPSTYRHVIEIGETNQYGTPQIRVQVSDNERVISPPPNYYIAIQHPSGSSVTITPSGTVTIVAGNPQQSSITMTPSGVITINSGAPVGGQTSPVITLNAQTGSIAIDAQDQKGIITIDNTGNIVIQSSGSGNIKIQSATNIVLQSSTDITLETGSYNTTLNTFISKYNEHYHSDPQGGNTGPTDPSDVIP